MAIWNWREWALHWWNDGPGKGARYADPKVTEAWESALRSRRREERRQIREGRGILRRMGYDTGLAPKTRYYDPVRRRFL